MKNNIANAYLGQQANKAMVKASKQHSEKAQKESLFNAIFRRNVTTCAA